MGSAESKSSLALGVTPTAEPIMFSVLMILSRGPCGSRDSKGSDGQLCKPN